MPRSSFPHRDFARSFAAAGSMSLPDAELLQRFARYGEHPAFDVLLRRHGPMVLGVCRRVLINSADVDDAFQAAFLVFVRKARTLRHGERLGPWLYGVAVRVSLKARSRRARLAARRTEATDMIPDTYFAVRRARTGYRCSISNCQALPAKYREPLVLCELEGASRAEAAQALGIPEGTLSSRLARGRELLRRRLLKHGTLLPAGGLVALFTANGIGRAAIPSALLAKTSEVAAVATTGHALAGMVPAGAAQLTDEVLKGMMLTKLRLACGAVLALGLVSTGVLAAWPTDAPAQAVKVGNAKATPPKSGAAPDSPDRRFRGNGQELRVEFADKGTVPAGPRCVPGVVGGGQDRRLQECPGRRGSGRQRDGRKDAVPGRGRCVVVDGRWHRRGDGASARQRSTRRRIRSGSTSRTSPVAAT